MSERDHLAEHPLGFLSVFEPLMSQNHQHLALQCTACSPGSHRFSATVFKQAKGHLLLTLCEEPSSHEQFFPLRVEAREVFVGISVGSDPEVYGREIPDGEFEACLPGQNLTQEVWRAGRFSPGQEGLQRTYRLFGFAPCLQDTRLQEGGLNLEGLVGEVRQKLCHLLQQLGCTIQFIPFVSQLSKPDQGLRAVWLLLACPGQRGLIEFGRLVQCPLLGADLSEQENDDELACVVIGRVEERQNRQQILASGVKLSQPPLFFRDYSQTDTLPGGLFL